MSIQVIHSNKAPKAAAFYSQAILSSSKYRLEVAGQIAISPETGKMIDSSLAEETEQIFQNIEGILSEIGWDLNNITKVRVFLLTMDDYKEMNGIYASKFKEYAPARICVAVKELPLGARIEIECLAEGASIIGSQ